MSKINISKQIAPNTTAIQAFAVTLGVAGLDLLPIRNRGKKTGLYYVDTNDLKDSLANNPAGLPIADSKPNENYIFAYDTSNGHFEFARTQGAAQSSYVGWRNLVSSGNFLNINNQIATFMLFNSKTMFDLLVAKKGMTAALFLYTGLLTYDYSRVEQDYVGRLAVGAIGYNPGKNKNGSPDPSSEATKAELDIKFTSNDPRNEDVKRKLFKEIFIPLLKDFFKNVDYISDPALEALYGGQTNGFGELYGTRGYTKIAIEGYRQFLEGSDNHDLMYDKFIELFAGNALAFFGNRQNGMTFLSPFQKLALIANFSLSTNALTYPLQARAIKNDGEKLLKALAADNLINTGQIANPSYSDYGWDTDINPFDLLGFQETDAVKELADNGADLDGDGNIDGQEIAATLNAAGNDYLEESFNFLAGLGGSIPESKNTRTGNQCALMSALVYGESAAPTSLPQPWKYYWLLNNKGQRDSNVNNRISPLGKPGNERIYPIEPDESINTVTAREFMNFCENGSDTNALMEDIARDQTKPAVNRVFDKMQKELWWVFEDDDGTLKETKLQLSTNNVNPNDDYTRYLNALEVWYSETDPVRKAQRLNEIMPNEAQTEANILKRLGETAPTTKGSSDFYYLEQLKIDFKGNTPATSKSDVTVEMNFVLSSLNALTSQVMNLDVRPFNDQSKTLEVLLYQLITLPNFGNLASGVGAQYANQFHPDYSRLRLKVYAADQHRDKAIILDLNTVDHTISRGGTDGLTQLTISLRGFFENTINSPEHDILTDDQGRKARLALVKQIEDATDKRCSDEDIRELERQKKDVFAKTKKNYSDIMQKLITNGCIHTYEYNKSDVTLLIRGLADISGNYISSASYSVRTAPKGSNSFFFLGDMLYYLLDSLYAKQSVLLLPSAKNLNTRLMIANIELPTFKNNKYEMVSFNPVSLPIDVEYFKQWFTTNIINKNIETMTIGLFLKEFLSKFINNLLYETCYSGLPIMQSFSPPEVTYTNRFTTDKDWAVKLSDTLTLVPNKSYTQGAVSTDIKTYGNKNVLFPKSPSYSGNQAKNNTRPVQGHNYMVVYPRYVAPIVSATLQTNTVNNVQLKDSPYCPTIFYGRLNQRYNFISDVSLQKQTKPHLRESRFFSSDFGDLSLLAGVYDLTFSFIDVGANTVFYPGSVINFMLLDWDYVNSGQNPYSKLSTKAKWNSFQTNNPHDPTTLAHIIGLGGYFMILSVSYTLGLDSNDFKITITGKFTGTDGASILRRPPVGTKNVQNSNTCGVSTPNAPRVPFIQPPAATTTTQGGGTGGGGGSTPPGGQQVPQNPNATTVSTNIYRGITGTKINSIPTSASIIQQKKATNKQIQSLRSQGVQPGTILYTKNITPATGTRYYKYEVLSPNGIYTVNLTIYQ